ncbi:MarR family winged helix-turn-helix transcriptional regulator [Aquimarina sp. 2201CG5-10]|uniref:MarR family winged helix-turn-helix transcriptional regulator n=1 Tax=Aquimarina callyspongiae TaxID=3098150 RepID=UPI002AB33991|nr:MarR family transcriptional regulator [Aquimarina sp. 2201CG5-10]MDY8137683.1 MarR family transcriptional regulator [Aquimarina sp. 2201CG5-10]
MDDFIKALGYKALDSRLKRISDRMAQDIRKLYKELEIDVEPNWYLIFMLLRDHKNLSIAQIAERLGYAHPSIVVIIQKMIKKGYVNSQKDDNDKRKQLIMLTPKAIDNLPELEKLWYSCEEAILKVLEEDMGILTYLDRIDNSLKTTSFHDRFKNEYLKN